MALTLSLSIKSKPWRLARERGCVFRGSHREPWLPDRRNGLESVPDDDSYLERTRTKDGGDDDDGVVAHMMDQGGISTLYVHDFVAAHHMGRPLQGERSSALIS